MENDASRKVETEQLQAGNEGFSSKLIPKSFNLGGLTINVEFDDTLCKNKKMIGEAQYHMLRIVLDTVTTKNQMIEQCFYHELIHWILYVMNEDELRNNEKFVDVFSQFLYQSVITAKYEPAASSEDPSSEGA